MSPRGESWSVFVLLWLAGVACSSAAHPSPVYVKIDDMEGSSGFIEWAPPTGLTPGLWYVSTDCSQADRVAPPPYFVDRAGWSYAELPAPHETLPGISSTHAARLRTTAPLAGIWGANMNIDFAEMAAGDAGAPDAGAPADAQPCRPATTRDFPAATVDLGAYAAVTFWAMSPGTGVKLVNVGFNDVNTDPRGGVCNAPNPGDETNCYNSFRTVIALTDQMTRYTVNLAGLVQDPNFGYHPDPDVLDLAHVYQMHFEVDTDPCATSTMQVCAGGVAPPFSFDIWVDDLYFVAK